jgi:hypothetical protein
MKKTIHYGAILHTEIGAIVHVGMYNGHVSEIYRVEKIFPDLTTMLTPMKAVSVKNANGTYSTVYLEKV